MAKSPNIAVAKINAWQAILVAVITTVGIFAGEMRFGGKSEAKTPLPAYVSAQPQCWLTVYGVQTRAKNITGRVIVYCDDVVYSVPPQTAWATLGAEISKTRFPLPMDHREHSVRFEIEEKDSGRKIPSHDVRLYKPEQIPTGAESYPVEVFSQNTSSGQVLAHVSFSIDK